MVLEFLIAAVLECLIRSGFAALALYLMGVPFDFSAWFFLGVVFLFASVYQSH